jgi:hypothetical protein
MPARAYSTLGHALAKIYGAARGARVHNGFNFW